MLDSQAPRRTARENACVPAEVLQAMARAGKLPCVTEATARCVCDGAGEAEGGRTSPPRPSRIARPFRAAIRLP